MEKMPEKKANVNNSKSAMKKNKKSAKYSRSSLKQMSREELEECVLQLSAHNVQLKSLLQQRLGQKENKNSAPDPIQKTNRKATKKSKTFDFDKYATRHILLKFAYLGWDHQGYAVQEGTPDTIEADLFDALLKTKLIKSRQTSNYHRCGRTDKGVSAFSQVISITVRSQLQEPDAAQACLGEELQYVELLNRVLPDHIRMLAWCPAPSNFSARFDCRSRTYKYFFPKGALDLQRMRDAGKLLEGYHDFRNFCKMDVGNGVVNFERHIDHVSIKYLKDDFREESNEAFAFHADDPTSCSDSEKELKNHEEVSESDDTSLKQPSINELPSSESYEMKNGVADDPSGNCIEDAKCSRECEAQSRNSPVAPGPDSDRLNTGYEMCVATISGKAFLWHQVRAIMAILLLVGMRKEQTSIVSALLNVKRHPRKPQYMLANEVPLCLFASDFPSDVVQWRHSAAAIAKVQSHLQRLWAHHSVRSSMLKRMLCEVARAADSSEPVVQQHVFLAPEPSKQYRPLLQRKTCESLETRVRHFVKRRKLDAGVLDAIIRGSKEAKEEDNSHAKNSSNLPAASPGV